MTEPSVNPAQHDAADHSATDMAKDMGANNSVAAALITAMTGFALLSVGDSVIKSIGGQWPGTAVAALRFLIGTVGLAILLLVRQGRAGFALPMPAYQIGRGLCLAIASAAFFSSVFLMPLADATAIVFISPALTSLISAYLLGEKVPGYIWTTIALALIGVAIILRPNFIALGPAAILPLIAALAMSVLMILNRKVAGCGTPLLMQFLLALFATPFLFVASYTGHITDIPALQVDWPSSYVVLVCVIVAVTATISHALLYLATTQVSASTVAPTTYIQLLVAIILGAIFYDNYPDLQSLGGAALIILGGLYLWRRSNSP